MGERANLAINEAPSRGELSVLFCGQSITEPLHHVGPSVHDYGIVHCVQSGRGKFTIRGVAYEVGAGESFFIFPGELHHYVADEADPWQYRWIGYRGSGVEQLLAIIGIGPHAPIVQGYRIHRVEALFRNVYKALQIGGSAGDMEAEGYMRVVLAEYARTTDKGSDANNDDKRSDIERQVEQAARWLSLQFDKSISIDELAHTLGYHRTYLSKMFRKQMGESPMQFLLRIRMERAKTLLMTTRLTIEQIAAAVGYEDALYFSKLYKKWYSHSPSSHRTEMQSGKPSGCLYF
ncbi:AraC family transcriptional regulator [Paenibacillus sp. chi10]|uniref:AraC family transcriptional regulator n=1 Tax=Paenibacillus suaedae TaxID=3077233 RepID=A0AAJ2N3I7_9BACL|nr:AraC family transcriptional regulator [Paenibacillus sp. chi10]MDT8975930.1 AraC family transcriptional regulator [Paenibacillus sp. chi10]